MEKKKEDSTYDKYPFKRSWFDRMYLPLSLGTVIIFLSIVGYFTISSNNKDLEKSKFMMECVYDHFQTPENCKKILEGQDPPKLPFEYE